MKGKRCTCLNDSSWIVQRKSDGKVIDWENYIHCNGDCMERIEEKGRRPK